MPKISRVAIFQVDLIPEVLPSDAIQAFRSIQSICSNGEPVK